MTIEQDWKDSNGFRHIVGKAAFSTTYATDGDTLSVGSYFRAVYNVQPLMLEDSGGYEVEVTDTNFAAPGSGIKILALIAEYTAGADGPLIEATATTDLSAVYFRIHVWGEGA